MKTQNTTKVVLAGAAMAGLLGGAAVRIQAAQSSSNDTTINAGQLADSSDSGVHSCKGKGGCATSSTKG